MKILLKITMPAPEFNKAVSAGTAGKNLQKILEELKPDAVYFTEFGGDRSCLMIVDVKNNSDIPKYGEPWFLLFNAKVEFHTVMTVQDLENAGLDELGKKWS
jgi:hypothetical protein